MQEIQGRCLCGAVRYRSDALLVHDRNLQLQELPTPNRHGFLNTRRPSKGALVMEGAQPDTYLDVGKRGLPVCGGFLKVRIANIHGSRGHANDGLAQGRNVG